MSKIRCPKCGRTDCDHNARHLAEAEEADYLAEKIYGQGKPVEELSDLELAEELIRGSGEDGYRRAVALVGRDAAEEIASRIQQI